MNGDRTLIVSAFAVYGDTADSELWLITCGGSVDRSVHSYRDNIIVYATLDSWESLSPNPVSKETGGKLGSGVVRSFDEVAVFAAAVENVRQRSARRILPIVAVVVLCLLTASSGTARADVNDFTFTAFSADYFLSRDQDRRSQLDVTERLTALFPLADQNHGIERVVPGSYDGHPVEIRILSATDGSGTALALKTSSSGDDVVMRVGNPDAYVHGVQTYVLHYTLRDITSNPAGHDELRLNTSGTQWRQPFESVAVRLHLDAETAAAYSGQSSCSEGAPDSGASCRMVRAEDGDGAVFAAASDRPMRPGENVSLLFRFTPGTFSPYPGTHLDAGTIAVLGAWGGINVLAIVIGAIFLVRLWRRRVTGVVSEHAIVPVSIAPAEASVPMAAFVCRCKKHALAAGVLDLVVRGYFTIYDTGTLALEEAGRHKICGFRLTRAIDNLRPEEKQLVRIVFGRIPKRGDRASSAGFPARVPDAMKRLMREADAEAVRTGLAHERAEHRKSYYWRAALLIVLGVVLVSPGIIAVGVATWLVTNRFSRLTDAGAELRARLLGLRMHLTTTAAEEEHTAEPSELRNPRERLLPYAVLFGLNRTWSSRLEPSARQTGSGNTFDYTYLTNTFSRSSSSGSQTGTTFGDTGGAGGGGGQGW